MALDLMSLVARLTLDKSDYDSGLTDAKEQAGGFAGAMKKGFAGAATAVTAVAGAATAISGVVAAQAGQVASYGDNIDKASQKLGISAEAYQEWQAVLQHSGTSMESMTSSFKTLQNAIAGPTEAQSMALKNLGIGTEIYAMNAEDAFDLVVQKLQEMPESARRTAIAQKLLGKGAMEMGALFNTSAADTQAMRDRVHELGGVMSNEAVKAAAAYQDSLQDMQTAIDGTKRNLISEFLPSLTSVMDGITELFTTGGTEKISQGISKFVGKISEIVPKMLEVGNNMLLSLSQAIIENLPTLIDAATQTIMTLVNGIVEQLPMLVEAGLQILLSLAQSIADNLPTLIPTIVSVVLQIVDTLTQPDTLSSLVTAAVEIIVALAEGLIDALPQLLEKAPTIITNLVEALLKVAPKVLDAGVKLIGELARGIVQSVGTVVSAIGQIGKSIVDNIGNVVSNAVNWGKDLIDNFTDGIKKFINKPIEAVKGLAAKVKSFLGFSEPEEGPLSDFHTYAPDMMMLFAQGITDNAGLITRAIGNSFDIAPAIGQSAGQEFSVPRGNAGGGRMLTAIFEFSGTEVGRIITPLIEAEQQRVGVRLASGGAY